MFVPPPDDILEAALSGLLGGKISLLSRRAFDYYSTFPVEIVNCMHEGGEIQLFCKFPGGLEPDDEGRKGGVEYEISVYEEVLARMDLPTAHFYGTCSFGNERMLVLEYLHGSNRVTKSALFNEHVVDAATWIGRMHRFWESKVPPFLAVYDEPYYRIWAERLTATIARANGSHEWIQDIHDFFVSNLEVLLSASKTIVHAEYYPDNILVKDNVVYPVDWESAAAAPGEIDLASLIENWPEPMAERIISAYQSARWECDNFSEEAFRKRLLMAEIYFYFRWVGHGNHFDIEPWLENPNTLAQLRRLASKAVSG